MGEKKEPSRQVVEKGGEGDIQRQAQGTERMRDCLRENTETSLGHLECEGPGTPVRRHPGGSGQEMKNKLGS